MMSYAEKLQIQQEARRYSFAYIRRANLKVKFDSTKKYHPLPPTQYRQLNLLSPPPPHPLLQVMSTLELDGYEWK